MCIKRGTFPSDKRDGRLYALLETAPTRDPTDRTDELIDELRDRVQSLEGQLQAEHQAHAEARRIIAGLVERIPALEAPQEPPEAQETVEDEPEAATPGPMPLGRRRARGAPGGGGCLGDERRFFALHTCSYSCVSHCTPDRHQFDLA